MNLAGRDSNNGHSLPKRNEIGTDAVCDSVADVLDHWCVVAREVEERESIE